MDQPACKLTLVFSVGVEDRIVELLLESDPPITGFTTVSGEGHGHDFGKAETSERVRGRINRRMLVAVMRLQRAEALLEEIRQRVPVRHLAYWIEPVLSFGILTPKKLDSPDPGPTDGRPADSVPATQEAV